MTDYRREAPEIIRSFLLYHETVKGHSRKTVDEYFLDLRTFFRYLKVSKGLVPRKTDLEEISIDDVDLAFVKSVTLSDVYDYLGYLSRDRAQQQNAADTGYGLNANSRARKVATIRSFYKYLTVKAHLIEDNPVQDLDSPKVMKSLPRYLSLEESQQLLSSVSGQNKIRDYCILTLFLNCGLRISELVGLNLSDVHGDQLRVVGKGNKERIVYLNAACVHALEDYLLERRSKPSADARALFTTSRLDRISRSAVHALVKKHIGEAGLDRSKYSAHKLRHTAATLMLHSGVDVRTLQELLGHEHLNTTEIYTHVEDQGLRRAAQLSPLADFAPEDRKDRTEDEENTIEE